MLPLEETYRVKRVESVAMDKGWMMPLQITSCINLLHPLRSGYHIGNMGPFICTSHGYLSVSKIMGVCVHAHTHSHAHTYNCNFNLSWGSAHLSSIYTKFKLNQNKELITDSVQFTNN